MELDKVIEVVWVAGLVFLVLLIVVTGRARRHGGSYRAGVVGAMYEMHNKDKQRALQEIVEEKEAKRPPESPDGDLPQLEKPRRS
jgi:hypothetical protein